jgi:2-phospho-L-lactate transferase/gluconeogenesis factor (CofD/UPF0052 family)
MRELGLAVDVDSVVAHYGARVAGWVIDTRDAPLAGTIEARGHAVEVTDTLMTDATCAEALARKTLALLERVGPHRS